MRQSNDNDRGAPSETFRGSLLFLVFGLSMLAFLVAIDRPEWFVLRPVSGTAVAMAKAAEPVSTTAAQAPTTSLATTR